MQEHLPLAQRYKSTAHKYTVKTRISDLPLVEDCPPNKAMRQVSLLSTFTDNGIGPTLIKTVGFTFLSNRGLHTY